MRVRFLINLFVVVLFILLLFSCRSTFVEYRPVNVDEFFIEFVAPVRPSSDPSIVYEIFIDNTSEVDLPQSLITNLPDFILVDSSLTITPIFENPLAQNVVYQLEVRNFSIPFVSIDLQRNPSTGQIEQITFRDEYLSHEIPSSFNGNISFDLEFDIPAFNISYTQSHTFELRYVDSPNCVVVGDVFPFSGGDGTIENPYKICTAYQADAIRDDLSSHYALFSHIELQDIWTPIGTSEEAFVGSLDGSGYAFYNLRIVESSNNNIGFFALLGEGAIINNVHLLNTSVEGSTYTGILAGRINASTSNPAIIRDVSVTGVVRGRNYVGGLVGYNQNGNITYAYSQTRVSGDQYVGGLIGYHRGMLSSAGSEAMVVGRSSSVGGLIGASYRGSITQSYSNSWVSGNDRVGGLIGEHTNSHLNQSYSNSFVVSNLGQVGGLVGTSTSAASVQQVYASGIVQSGGSTLLGGGLIALNDALLDEAYSIASLQGSFSSESGGLVGDNTNMVTNSYWDITHAGVLSSSGGDSRELLELLCPEGAGETCEEVLTYKDWSHQIWNFQSFTEYPILNVYFVRFEYPQNSSLLIDRQRHQEEQQNIGVASRLIRFEQASMLDLLFDTDTEEFVFQYLSNEPITISFSASIYATQTCRIEELQVLQNICVTISIQSGANTISINQIKPIVTETEIYLYLDYRSVLSEEVGLRQIITLKK